jgi:Radical SAM superfamily
VRNFHFIMIKPSHYDDDGYVIRWFRSVVPSNSLAALYGLAEDCAARQVLGEDVNIVLTAYDETNTRIDADAIIRLIKRDGGHGLVGFVGVQSNQFPRAVDIARPLRAAGIAVCIGGFHVSGCLAMLPELPDDIRAAQRLGIALFAGEAEAGRLERILQDADRGTLLPLYNYLDDLPGLEGEVTPFLPATRVRRTATGTTSFDAGRGCPFQCSFCTIINVQGRKSRYRSADDVERIIRANHAQGVRDFFITDDNFARNRNWAALFDRLILLREEQGFPAEFTIQVDTLCHRIPGFVEKAARAGVFSVFIGLENINPDNLKEAKKRQNKITEYRAMLQAWKQAGVTTFAGYILGFPGDTPDSIRRDIRIIQEELAIDFLEFFILTPLPGSEDHKKLWEQGVPMDPDMNKYDVNHVTTDHPRMSRDELQQIWWEAWAIYYSRAHLATIIRRAVASGIAVKNMLVPIAWFWGSIFVNGLHPLEGGFFRKRARRERRPGFPIERPATFYLRYGLDILAGHLKLAGFGLWLAWTVLRIRLDPARRTYSDRSLAAVEDEELDAFELFTITDTAKAAVTAKRAQDARRRASAAG